MNYQQLLQKLYQVNLFGGMKLGLANSFALDKALGYPSTHMRFIHVAGTNGKGSVSTKIAKALELSGYRTGLFTSPHISSFRERIRINGEMISEKAVETVLPALFEIANRENLTPTFFEYTTLLALNYFQQEHVDYAVLETGLGGRLDATNIITPEVSIITSISLEHTEILGHTLEEIAQEKAGIIKPNTPIIIGPRVPYKEIQTIANEKNAPLVQLKGSFETFQQENEAIAETALDLLKIDPIIIRKAVKAMPPCRMEIFQQDEKVIIFDVGHNPDGLKQLFIALEKQYPQQRPCVVFGLSKTKDIDGCVEILKDKASWFYPVVAPNGRGLPQGDLKALLLKKGVTTDKVTSCATIKDSLQHALANHTFVLVCGTFFIMADARKALNINEPLDPLDMNESGKVLSG